MENKNDTLLNTIDWELTYNKYGHTVDTINKKDKVICVCISCNEQRELKYSSVMTKRNKIGVCVSCAINWEKTTEKFGYTRYTITTKNTKNKVVVCCPLSHLFLFIVSCC